MDGGNRRLVIALGAALGCSLLLIAFLLGRVTARPAERAPAVETATAAIVPAAPALPTVPAPERAAAILPTATSDGPAPEAAAFWTPPANFDTRSAPLPAVSTAVSTATSTATPSPDRQVIAAYFAQIEQIDDVGAGDPQAFATSILESMSSGDFSGFDNLLAKARAQRQRLQSVATPRACVEHHSLALALAGDSVALLERVRTALVKGDSTALLTMAAEGRTMEEQANRLKSLGESIKRSAGL